MAIDLGDVSAPPPSGSWSAQVGGARLLALVAVALVALALGGSAVPAPQVGTVLVTDELPGAFALSRSALITTGYVGARAQVRRYPLTGTSTEWTTELRRARLPSGGPPPTACS